MKGFVYLELADGKPRSSHFTAAPYLLSSQLIFLLAQADVNKSHSLFLSVLITWAAV